MSSFWVSGGEEVAVGGEKDETRAEEGDASEVEEEEARHNLGQAWEIDFGSSDAPSKPKKLPRFLSKGRSQAQTVTVKATPTPTASGARGTKQKEIQKPKSTPVRTSPVKPRGALSAPAKTSSKMVSSKTNTGATSRLASKSVATVTPLSSTSYLSTTTSTTTSRPQRQSNSVSPLSSAVKTRPASAPSTASKLAAVNNTKSLFSKRKTTPKSAASGAPADKTGRKLSSMWRKRGSKDKIKTPGGTSDVESEGGARGSRGADKNPQRRALSMKNQKAGGRGRGGEQTKILDTFQSSGEIDNGWGEGVGEWGGPTDERGFDSSGVAEGSWSRRQDENFERLRSMQFSPRMQTTPDLVAAPHSRVTHRKLKEVQRWVHEVTVHTRQMSEEVGDEVAEGVREGGEGCRMAVYPGEMASRKMLDLRRW